MYQTVLTYGEFVTYMRENLEDRLEDISSVRVSVTEIVKNNQVVQDTLMVCREGSSCSPVFYLKDLYGLYLQGEHIDRIVDSVAEQYGLHADDHQDLGAEWFDSLDHVWEKIILKVVNYEKNAVQLQHCPHIRELDLALTFRVLLDLEQEQIGTVLVTDAMMREWDVTEYDLFEQAVENMHRLWRPTMEPMGDVLAALTDMKDETEQVLGAHGQIEMYVLSNEMRLNGAAELFCTDYLKELAGRQQRNIYILPSSVHEVLLIPETDGIDPWDFRRIVEQVNHQLVSEEEILSDHVYRYLYREARLTIAA